MQITINYDKKELSVDIQSDEKVTYEVLLNALLGAFAHCTTKLLEETSMEDEAIEDLCFSLEDVFEHILYDEVFPQLKSLRSEFELSDAAVLKAQDEIISEAAERGISYKEALDEYNEKAEEYVRKMS